MNFLGVSGKHLYCWKAPAFGLGSFYFGFPCFLLSARFISEQSRWHRDPVLWFSLHRACTSNSRADLVFKGSALYSCSSALTSRPRFFVICVIASVWFLSALTSFFRDSALYPCPSALTSQSCYRPPPVSAELLKATRADPVKLNLSQFYFFNLLVWLSPALSTWFVTWYSLFELLHTCLQSLVERISFLWPVT